MPERPRKSWHRKLAETISDPINNAILGKRYMEKFRREVAERKRREKQML